MTVTLFWSHLRDDAQPDYGEWATRMEKLARAMPGFVSFKTFRAEDGERLSVIAFENEEALRAWREHPEHREAQRLGRERFYADYRIQTCSVTRERSFRG